MRRLPHCDVHRSHDGGLAVAKRANVGVTARERGRHGGRRGDLFPSAGNYAVPAELPVIARRATNVDRWRRPSGRTERTPERQEGRTLRRGVPSPRLSGVLARLRISSRYPQDRKNHPEKKIVALRGARICEAHAIEIRRLFAMGLPLRIALTVRAYVWVIERSVRVAGKGKSLGQLIPERFGIAPDECERFVKRSDWLDAIDELGQFLRRQNANVSHDRDGGSRYPPAPHIVLSRHAGIIPPGRLGCA